MVRSLLAVGVSNARRRDLHVITKELHLVLDTFPGVRAQYVAAAARPNTFLRLRGNDFLQVHIVGPVRVHDRVVCLGQLGCSVGGPVHSLLLIVIYDGRF